MRAMLAASLIAFLLLFGYQHFTRPGLSMPAPSAQVHPQTNRPAGEHGPSQTANSPQPAAATHELENNSKSSESKTPFGWLTFIATPLYLALRFLDEHAVGNWGWAIVMLTAIFNLLMIWPRTMQMKTSLKMMRLQPKVDALRKRYAHLKTDDPRRAEMNREMMAVYKAEGANVYGCLPKLLQMPLLFAYFRVLQNAVELHHAPWLWLTDLSSPDPLHILPLFILVTMFATQCITPTPGMEPAQRRIFAIAIPAIMGFTLWRSAAGPAIYWATGNLINLLIQISINRSKTGKEMRQLADKRAIP